MAPPTRAPAAAAPFGLVSGHGTVAVSLVAASEQTAATTATAISAATALDTRPGQVVREPQLNDIILGRGVPLTKYPGNVSFRALIRVHKDAYNSTGRHHSKQNVASAVLNEIRRRQGRFLDKIETANENGTQAFYIVGEDVALTKIKQALREMGPATTKPGQSKRKRAVRQEVAPEKEVGAPTAAPIQAPRNEGASTAAMNSANAVVGPLQVAPCFAPEVLHIAAPTNVVPHTSQSLQNRALEDILPSQQQQQQPRNMQPGYVVADPNPTTAAAHPSLVAAWLQSTAQHQYEQRQQMMLPYLMALQEQRRQQQQQATPPSFSAMGMMQPFLPSPQPSFQLPAASSTSTLPAGMGVNDLSFPYNAYSNNASLLSILLAAQQQRERQLQAGPQQHQMGHVAPSHPQQLQAAPPPPHPSMHVATPPTQPIPQLLFQSQPELPQYQHQPPTLQAQFQALVDSQVAAAEASDASRQACLSLLRTAHGPMVAAAYEIPAVSTVARANAASRTERVVVQAIPEGADSNASYPTLNDGHHPTNALGPLLAALAQKHPDSAFGPELSGCAHHDSHIAEDDRKPPARQQNHSMAAANGNASSCDSNSSCASSTSSSCIAKWDKRQRSE